MQVHCGVEGQTDGDDTNIDCAWCELCVESRDAMVVELVARLNVGSREKMTAVGWEENDSQSRQHVENVRILTVMILPCLFGLTL